MTCGTCKHWAAPEPALIGSEGDVLIEAETHGICAAITFTRINDERPDDAALLTDYAGLATLATFGCVLHVQAEAFDTFTTKPFTS